jgi:plastocyanin
MNLALIVHTYATRVWIAAWIVLVPYSQCRAGELTVTVVDRSGQPVSEVVTTVAPARLSSSVSGVGGTTAIMDQKDLAFLPQVLVVAVGTRVEFPNNDSVSHQVYSFSPAKKFQLPLYKGALHPPVTFDTAGLVVLGCNIHDQMAGYIYVTEAPLFGKTDSGGVLHFTHVSEGDYVVKVWSPFIADSADTLTHSVKIADREPTNLRLQLVRDQRPRPEPSPRRSDWEY